MPARGGLWSHCSQKLGVGWESLTEKRRGEEEGVTKRESLWVPYREITIIGTLFMVKSFKEIACKF
jgi:hypothetical protein